MPACCAGAAGTGPGFATPLDAYKSGQREQLAYVPVTSVDHTRPDYLATIDLDPASPTHSQARRCVLRGV
jgi:selenium-binding protein 1